ncbi:MAG: LacI family DNA-binding transcriptional regulator [Aggregatilineales bacterium]
MSSDARPKRATLNDVAKAAGVSYQTVSRVINGSPQVSSKTRRRVMQEIQTLGFRPNRAAQALAKRRTFTLEVISFGLDYFGPAQMLTSVERAAKTLGYKTMFSTSDDMTSDDLHVLGGELAGLVDGVIIISPVSASNFAQIAQAFRGLPFIQVGNRLGDLGPSVVIDQGYGIALAVKHLLNLGHRRIAEIAGPLNWGDLQYPEFKVNGGPLHWYDAEERHDGWITTLQTNGLDTSMIASGDWTATSGYEAMQQLLDTGADFSAVVAGNDQMALGAMRALRERGLGIPGDVSIVGFDDLPEAAYFEPPLTTIRQDFAGLGKQSVEYLIQMIESPDTPPHQRVLQPSLITRNSTRAV